MPAHPAAYRPTRRSSTAQQADGPERFIAFKELLINNGLSNTRNALRSALAIAEITNRTLILPQARAALARWHFWLAVAAVA